MTAITHSEDHVEHEDHIEEAHDHHVCSTGMFLGILLALFFLTFITVWVSLFDFGPANLLIAMAIAALKASLVIAVFMHMLWDTTINKLFFLSSFLFLGLLFLFTFADLVARSDMEIKHGRTSPLNPLADSWLIKPGEDPAKKSAEQKFHEQWVETAPAK